MSGPRHPIHEMEVIRQHTGVKQTLCESHLVFDGVIDALTAGENGEANNALNISMVTYATDLIRIKDGSTVLATFDPGAELTGEHTVRVVYDGTAHLLDFYYDVASLLCLPIP